MKKMGTGRERGRLSPGRLRDPGSCVGKESPRTSSHRAVSISLLHEVLMKKSRSRGEGHGRGGSSGLSSSGKGVTWDVGERAGRD